MSIMLLALVIDNYNLEHELKVNAKEAHQLKLKDFQQEIEIDSLRMANNMAINQAKNSAKVVEKKIVEIKKVYVPQIEYIDRYIGDGNETNCDDVNGLLKSVVY